MNSESASSTLGTLYLVPAPLDFGCAEQGDIAAVLPPVTLQAAARLRYWVVENAKSTRAVLKRISASTPLVCTLQEMQISEMPRVLHKKGDQAAGVDAASIRALLAPLAQGHDVGLMSEAGMPAVADPGAAIVRVAHELGAQVVPLVGPTSLLLALAASGLNGQHFAFVGYLPQQAPERSARIKQLETLAQKTGQTQICIETPYRNAALFDALLASLQPATRLSISSGLTLENAFTLSLPISEWRKLKTERLARLQQALAAPCIFAWGI